MEKSQMEYFQFKQFKVKNVASAMKLGTDSVLLGAWLSIDESEKRMLDVGTGTGVVALMAAQKVSGNKGVQIDAIDIDKESVEEAAHNFLISPWSDILSVKEIPLQMLKGVKYDHIFSNPPFFVDSLKAPSARRSNTRHTDSLPFGDLIKGIITLLNVKGKFSLILPCDEGELFIKEATLAHVGTDSENRLSLARLTKVYTKMGKPCKRYLMEFHLLPVNEPSMQPDISELCMIDSPQYNSMVYPYLLDKKRPTE